MSVRNIVNLLVLSIVALMTATLPAFGQCDTLRRDSLQRDTVQLDTLLRDTVLRDTLQRDTVVRDTVLRDTVVRDAIQRDTIQRETFQRDSLENAVTDSLRVAVRDSLRTIAPAVGVNLAWAGISAPNLSFELPLSDHFSLGISGGYKPWRRWSPLDWDDEATKKWAHLAVLPYLRWWPDVVFDGFFLEGDLIYSHYNVANIKLPFGLYPDIANNRLQGDFYGAGLSVGYSLWLTTHVNLTLAAGILAGYKSAVKYECPWCGGEVGRPEGIELVPRLDVSVAYHLFDLKRNVEKKLNAEKKKRD